MRACVPVDADGRVDPRWGRAHWVAVADLDEDAIRDWRLREVSWDELNDRPLHDRHSEGAHRARVARFLRDHRIDAVVAGHMGPGMLRMLRTMGVTVYLGASGDPREAAAAAAAMDAERAGGHPGEPRLRA